MSDLLITVLVNGLAVYLTAYLLPSVQVKGYFDAVVAGVFISIVNAILRPVLIFLTIPITILTLGFFLLVINALMILLVSRFLSGFSVGGLWSAMLFSIVLSIINYLLGWIIW
ncbi:phage holin family protein [Xanthovirga aplysinae]|uniref:phage holin family protein n=1 Tax=Xanthovirga aplysinae TaxID=2529853 RepID=UPI0012BD3508|nr:phage holin family protein [Xanthovirga aplysinae]MTI31495.1 phage holin family protein [Xanthovirga aplysinae]